MANAEKKYRELRGSKKLSVTDFDLARFCCDIRHIVDTLSTLADFCSSSLSSQHKELSRGESRADAERGR